MSHIVTIHAQVRDPLAVQAACKRLQIPCPVHRTVRLFSTEVTGLAVELPGWRYPVVCQTATGQLQYDNFQGRWGEPRELEKFLQRYAAEKVKLEARRQGQTVVEQPMENGSLRLQIAVAG